MNKKEKLAREYRLKATLNTERYFEGGSNIEKAYIAGWDTAIDKACEWLKENAYKYIVNTTPSYPDADFEASVGGKCWEDFKKEMEE